MMNLSLFPVASSFLNIFKTDFNVHSKKENISHKKFLKKSYSYE